MDIVRDNTVVTDNFSYIAPPTPPAPAPATPAPAPITAAPASATPTPSGAGHGGGHGGGGRHRRHHGGHHGVHFSYPLYGGYGYYPPYQETVVIEDSKKDEKKDKPSVEKATPIDMMGITPYIMTGAIGAVAGYFIAQNRNTNVWGGAGIGAAIVIGGMLVYNQSQKK